MPLSHYRYTETFEELCPYYLNIGMTYYDFWDGDPSMVRAYREKEKHTRDRENFNFWLQGMYIYEAILDIAPVLRAFSKSTKPTPYRSEPISISSTKTEAEKKMENKQKMRNGKEAMMQMMAEVNKKFEK